MTWPVQICNACRLFDELVKERDDYHKKACEIADQRDEALADLKKICEQNVLAWKERDEAKRDLQIFLGKSNTLRSDLAADVRRLTMERDEAVKRAEKAEAALNNMCAMKQHGIPPGVTVFDMQQTELKDLRARYEEAVGLLRRFASADAMHEAPWNDNTAFLAKHDAREGGKC